MTGTITKFQLSRRLSCKPFWQSTTCTSTIETKKSNPIPLIKKKKKKKKKRSNPTIKWLSCKSFWPLLLIQWPVTMLGSSKLTPNFKPYIIVFFSFLLSPTTSASLSLLCQPLFYNFQTNRSLHMQKLKGCPLTPLCFYLFFFISSSLFLILFLSYSHPVTHTLPVENKAKT